MSNKIALGVSYDERDYEAVPQLPLQNPDEVWVKYRDRLKVWKQDEVPKRMLEPREGKTVGDFLKHRDAYGRQLQNLIDSHAEKEFENSEKKATQAKEKATLEKKRATLEKKKATLEKKKATLDIPVVGIPTGSDQKMIGRRIQQAEEAKPPPTS